MTSFVRRVKDGPKNPTPEKMHNAFWDRFGSFQSSRLSESEFMHKLSESDHHMHPVCLDLLPIVPCKLPKQYFYIVVLILS